MVHVQIKVHFVAEGKYELGWKWARREQKGEVEKHKKSPAPGGGGGERSIGKGGPQGDVPEKNYRWSPGRTEGAAWKRRLYLVPGGKRGGCTQT